MIRSAGVPARLACAVLGVLLAAPLTSADDKPARPAGAIGTLVIPDHFLRRYDPVTIFFTRDAGPAKPAPEDQPQRLVNVTPAHPGAWRWLDARTLQFRPAEPWPSLARYRFAVEETTTTLSTLMAAPSSSVPSDGTEGLDPVSEFTLKFPEPLDPGALPKMVSVELKPLPGIGPEGARVLPPDAFTVKPLERSSRTDPAAYVFALKEPIPLGTRAVVRLRLSLDDSDKDTFKELSFSTAEPFRVTAAGCRERRYPVTPRGTRYPAEQALACGAGNRLLVVEFSAPPQAAGPVLWRNLLRFTPAVKDLSFSLTGRTLEVRGGFAWETLYTLGLEPTALQDDKGRPLDQRERSELFVYFARQSAYVKWTASQGMVERLGPQMVPVEGRGEERLDLRIHRIDPLDRSLWPFPERPLMVDESRRPPGPGEESPLHTAPDRNILPGELTAQLLQLGSPPVSALVSLPLKREGGAATFGLDLAPHLAKIAGAGRPGTYLVGLRDLAGGGLRSWMWLQATDLSLSTLEEPSGVRFAVTSLSTSQAVAGARVRLEGTFSDRGTAVWKTLAEGLTDAAGAWTFAAPGLDRSGRTRHTLRRIVVEKDGDTLVLDPTRPPERYADNQWSKGYDTWLQWLFEDLSARGPKPQELAHIFTERPVYRPEEEVHIKGYLRRRERGRLTARHGEGLLIVEGPSDLAWKYPVTLTEAGSFYHKFLEQDIPTGTYTAHFESVDRKERLGRVAFQIEAYKIPRFEVTLHAPEKASLDRAFDVSLTASYYAGGKVGGQGVQWRVTQFPYTFEPKQQPGFRYSSDARYSKAGKFTSTPRLTRDDVTDSEGGARIALDPTLEPTAEPRSYVVEATVTGPDDQTVTATRTIPALPPFVLGLKAPRFLEQAKTIPVELLAAGADGELVEGMDISVRLLRREWHSHLQQSDFSDGIARYITDVVDVKVSEQNVKSGKQPLALTLPLDRAGVYVIELTAHDRLDRTQVVSVDLYAGGDSPVTWPKPVTPVFSVATDQSKYDPGQSAAVVLKSPFQSARALAIIEAPEGNEYQWVAVEGGAATFRVPIKGSYAPRVPVHFVLMRGRLTGTGPLAGNATDLGKPATMAATAWLDVNPLANQVSVKLAHPESARPGQKVDVTITLTDPKGAPLPGEVTLWLVDQAVLSLGREQRLDPLPDFITAVRSHLGVHDTRNLPFGALPFAESPGGDGGDEDKGLLDRATVRKNFKSVPYYNPAILVGPSGVVTVTVQLSDDLTNFKLRAKAASGEERFGVGTGTIAVRLPVIVQPALPRFVRPGDSFTAAAIARVVEGPAGAGSAEVRATGVELQGPATRSLTFTAGKPERIDVPVRVPTPPYKADGSLAYDHVSFKIGVSRTSDGATDAFEVPLPVRDDRERVTLRAMEDLKPGTPWLAPAVTEAARPGTLRRELVLSREPALLRMLAGLDFLRQYPYGCTEQQTSRARSYLALRKLRSLLAQKGGEKETDRAVKDTLAWLPTIVDANGLAAYWPGSTGTVSLTAWVVQFLVEAKDAGYPIDEKLLARLNRALDQALRSDYSHFVDGEAYSERAWALIALTQAGASNSAYAAELARKSAYLDLEGVASVVQAFTRDKQESAVLGTLTKELWDGLIVRLHQGREIYGGLQERRATRSGLVLPSEARTLAEVTRALVRREPKSPRVPVLVDALVTLGRDDGWGTTNANAAALLALAELFQPSDAGAAQTLEVTLDGKPQTVTLDGKTPLVRLVSTGPGEVVVKASAGASPVVARLETSYVPAQDGSRAAARQAGFVVVREALLAKGEGVPLERVELGEPGRTVALKLGDVVEDHVQVTNPKERHYVAIAVPLAAGMEPLNPRLLTAPPEAKPKGTLTLEPTYVAFLDDQVTYFYNTLPAGSFDFYFRTRATTPGEFIQPPAKAEMMYDGSVVGGSVGARIKVDRAPEAASPAPKQP